MGTEPLPAFSEIKSQT